MADEPAPAPRDDLGRRTRQGLSWTAAGALATNVIRIASFAILGRLLAPGDFGVIAAAMVVIQLGTLIKDLGVGLALVQRRDLDREHVEVAFTFSLLLGAAISATIVLAAGPLAALFNIERSIDILRALGLLFVLRSFASVSTFLCQREMNFRALALIDATGYLAGGILSIVLAATGAGAWSLAWGYFLETAIGVALLIRVAPPPRRLRWHPRALRELLGFGTGKSLGSIANFFAMQGDYIVVGHMLGKTPLGFYQRAYELVRFPASVFSNVAGNVLFSAFAKVQDDLPRVGRAFRRATFASAVVLLPVSIVLIVLAPEIVRLVMGTQWGDMVLPFRIMAATMLFRTTYKLGAIVGRSAGQIYKIAACQALYATMVVGGAAISIRWGIVGVACTTTVAIVVNYVALTLLGLRMTDLRPRDIVVAHGPALAMTIAVGGITWVVATALRGAGMPYLVVAGVGGATALACYAGLVVLELRRGHGEWPWLKQTVAQVIGRRRGRSAAQRSAT